MKLVIRSLQGTQALNSLIPDTFRPHACALCFSRRYKPLAPLPLPLPHPALPIQILPAQPSPLSALTVAEARWQDEASLEHQPGQSPARGLG